MNAGTGSRDVGLTERQRKWFASVEAGLVRDTGRPLAEWAEIARACPETTPKARVRWLKEQHGLGVNRAAAVLEAAFPSAMGWDDPDALRASLWKDPKAAAILAALEAAVLKAGDVLVGQRKTYTAFSRSVQFAAARPLKGGRALLGLKLDPGRSSRLSAPARRESWSERLTATVELAEPRDVDAEIEALLAQAAAAG